MDAIATCIGIGTLGSIRAIFGVGGALEIFLLDFAGLGADFAEDVLDTDFDAVVRDGPLMETRFAAFSSGAGDAGLFFPAIFPAILPAIFPPAIFPPTAVALFADIGSDGLFATTPPLIFSAKSFLRQTKQNFEPNCKRLSSK